jgi:hypothetical protein
MAVPAADIHIQEPGGKNSPLYVVIAFHDARMSDAAIARS